MIFIPLSSSYTSGIKLILSKYYYIGESIIAQCETFRNSVTMQR